MLQFVPIASSSAGCAYLVRHPAGSGNHLLVDCGGSMLEISKACGFETSRLAGCLVSHGHGDHVKNAAALMKVGVGVHASKETIEMAGLAGNHFARVLQPFEKAYIGPWLVMPFPVEHDCPGTFGFVLDDGEGGRLVYLTDTAFTKYKIPPGTTHIAVEANWGEEQIRENRREEVIGSDRFKRTVSTHMSIERVVTMLKANDLGDVREIWLLHLSDANSDEEAFKEAVQKATGKLVYVAAARQKVSA